MSRPREVLTAILSEVMLYVSKRKWVEASNDSQGFRCGNGGDRWVEDHIEAHVGIGSTLLGVTKSMTAFLSGESPIDMLYHTLPYLLYGG